MLESGTITERSCLLPPRRRALEGGLNAGDTASFTTQPAVPVPSTAHRIFTSWCADSLRIADLVPGSSGEVELGEIDVHCMSRRLCVVVFACERCSHSRPR